MSKDYLTSRTQEDFTWPRVVPLLERPALPPLKTGIRVFCREADADFCKQDDYQEYDPQQDCCNFAKFDEKDDDNVLMSRKKFMLLNESLTCKPIIGSKKMKSTNQIDFAPDELTYDDFKDQLQVPRDEAAFKKCLTEKSFYDPFPFKKINDKPPLIA